MKVLRRYHIQVREDYVKYNRLVGGVHQLVTKLKKLPSHDPYRVQAAEQLMNKLCDDNANAKTRQDGKADGGPCNGAQGVSLRSALCSSRRFLALLAVSTWV